MRPTNELVDEVCRLLRDGTDWVGVVRGSIRHREADVAIHTPGGVVDATFFTHGDVTFTPGFFQRRRIEAAVSGRAVGAVRKATREDLARQIEALDETISLDQKRKQRVAR